MSGREEIEGERGEKRELERSRYLHRGRISGRKKERKGKPEKKWEEEVGKMTREGEKTRRRLREEGKVKKYLYSTFKAKVYLFIADILAIKLRLKVLLFYRVFGCEKSRKIVSRFLVRKDLYSGFLLETSINENYDLKQSSAPLFNGANKFEMSKRRGRNTMQS